MHTDPKHFRGRIRIRIHDTGLFKPAWYPRARFWRAGGWLLQLQKTTSASIVSNTFTSSTPYSCFSWSEANLRKERTIENGIVQTRSPAQHRTRASADQRRTCRKKELLKTGDDVCQHRVFVSNTFTSSTPYSCFSWSEANLQKGKRKKELLKTASCQTRSPAQHRTRASADQRRTCRKTNEKNQKTIESSVPDQWHFETDPDSDSKALDPYAGLQIRIWIRIWIWIQIPCSFLQWLSRHQFSKILYRYRSGSSRSHKTVEIKVFLIFLLVDPDLHPDQDAYKITDPDPGSSNHTDPELLLQLQCR